MRYSSVLLLLLGAMLPLLTCLPLIPDPLPTPLPSTLSKNTYLGCFSDRADMQHRSLPQLQEMSDTMTVDKCLSKCNVLGFAYSGLQYRSECYCSKRPPQYEKLSDALCNQDCSGGGDKKCGGALALSVYHYPDVPQPTFDKDRPLLCLVMILKNEAHTVNSTFNTVRDVIDCWQILDTGSTDGTQDIIKKEMANIPGKLYEEPFVDYGATRNRILVLAKENANPIFTLMLSADETVMNPQDLRDWLLEMRYSRGTQHGAYPVVMNTGLKFDSIRIARVDSLWRYRARVHEYLAPPEGPYVGLYRPRADINVRFNATDGPRRFQSQYFIRKILEEDLERNPNDTRSIYYLARTNSGINNHSQAFYYYDLLSKRATWDEERYHGMVMKAIETKFLDVHWSERQKMLLDAFNMKPNNMDALHALAQDHFDSGRPQLAYLFALRAVSLPMPPALHSIENVLLRPTKYLYDYEGHRLLGFAAREIGEWEQCVISFRKVLSVNKDDTIVKNRVLLCEEELKKKGKFIQPDKQPENAHIQSMDAAKPSVKLSIPGVLDAKSPLVANQPVPSELHTVVASDPQSHAMLHPDHTLLQHLIQESKQQQNMYWWGAGVVLCVGCFIGINVLRKKKEKV